jgi:hypothetical protein
LHLDSWELGVRNRGGKSPLGSDVFILGFP